MYHIDYLKFFDTLGIESDMRDYPRIISESELKLLTKNKVILDAEFNTIHNTHVLTKKFAGENTNLLSTEEFIDQLKNHVKLIDKTKRNIYQMMNIIGDIWVKEFKIKFLSGGSHYKVYGKSRYQCEKFLNDLIEKTNINFVTEWPIELLIKDNNNFREVDILKYQTMIEYMKENNINKFPFSTYKEEEQ